MYAAYKLPATTADLKSHAAPAAAFNTSLMDEKNDMSLTFGTPSYRLNIKITQKFLMFYNLI